MLQSLKLSANTMSQVAISYHGALLHAQHYYDYYIKLPSGYAYKAYVNINFIFSLGSHPRDTSLCICRPSKMQLKCFETPNTSDPKGFLTATSKNNDDNTLPKNRLRKVCSLILSFPSPTQANILQCLHATWPAPSLF